MGGITGHLKHIYEYDTLTGADVCRLATDLMLGKVSATEKVDGLNIQVTINDNGNIRFIRNKGDVNNGGMSFEDIAEKWKDNKEVRDCYIDAACKLISILNPDLTSYFNPDENTKRAFNVECLCGKTNAIPYNCNKIYIHNVFVYKKTVDGWVNVDIEDLPDVFEGFKSPTLDFDRTDSYVINDYINRISTVLPLNMTIDEYKFKKFYSWCEDFEPWILEEDFATKVLYERWFKGIKAFNLTKLKDIYGSNAERLVFLDKGYRHIVSSVMKVLDAYIIELGQIVLGNCKGYINYNEDINMMSDLFDAVDYLMESGDEETVYKLNKQIDRLYGMVYPLEGIVFNWNGLQMKLTGNFAPYNQILGMKKFGK